MSCRHDLAINTCKRCYPKTGTIEPGPEEDYEPNLEGPGAITIEEYTALKKTESCQNPNPIFELEHITRAINYLGIKAILFGNAAAFLHGAPVRPNDLDFIVPEINQDKINDLVSVLKAQGGQRISYKNDDEYEIASVWRIWIGSRKIQIDFTDKVSGDMSFSEIESRGTAIEFSSKNMLVASLKDVIDIKRAAGRPKDLEVLPALEATLASAKPESALARNPIYIGKSDIGDVIKKIGYVRPPETCMIVVHENGQIMIATEGMTSPMLARVFAQKCRESGMEEEPLLEKHVEDREIKTMSKIAFLATRPEPKKGHYLIARNIGEADDIGIKSEIEWWIGMNPHDALMACQSIRIEGHIPIVYQEVDGKWIGPDDLPRHEYEKSCLGRMSKREK